MNHKNFVSLLLAAILAFTMVGTVSSGSSQIYLPLVVNGSNTPPPTSIQLIEQALAAGRLDANTAAIYEVYSLLPNSPLPAEYRGVPDPMVDIAPFAALGKVYATLSPAQKASVVPYLMRPDNRSSAYFQFQQQQQGQQLAASQSAPSPIVSATRPPDTIQWAYLDTATGVRIHYRLDLSDDYGLAVGVGKAIDAKIYSKLNTLMGRVWLDDSGCTNEEGGVDNGGNGALDIYLMHATGNQGLTVSCGSLPSPGWITLNADYPIGSEKESGMIQTAAHEMLHAIQYSYAYLEDWSTYVWVWEATAMWVEDYVYHDAQSEQLYADLYLNKTGDPMDFNPDKLRYYGEYLWPFYLYRVKGYNPNFIRTMFESAKSYSSADIFLLQEDKDTPVTLFPDFAVKNWNQAPFDNYQTVDTLKKRVAVQYRDLISGVVKKDAYELKNYASPGFTHLSALYYDYVFEDDTARTVTFYNGVSYKLSEGTGFPFSDGSEFYKTDDLNIDQSKGMNIQALIKINDVWTLEDWSYTPIQVYCRDRGTQRIQELVLIITNSNYKDSQPNYTFQAVGKYPTLLVSPTGCYQWKGTFDVEDTSDPGVTSTINGEAVFEASDSLYGPSVVYSLQSGKANLKISGTSSDKNFIYSVNGWATLGPNDPPKFNFLGTYNMVTGGPHPDAYYGNGYSTQTVAGTLKSCCDEDGNWITDNNYPFLVGTWFLDPDSPANQMKSQSQGNTITGSYTDTVHHITYSWNFKEQEDP
jgi:hypothetical protein